jgi:hypothetical protein
MIQIKMSHAFPVSVHEAFSYITDLENWKEYWPGFVRIINALDVKWKESGDTVVLVIRLIGREVELHMRLTDFQQDARVCYRSHQLGLPTAQHERYWRPTVHGCEYQIVVNFEPRQGVLGIFDRFVLQQSIRNAVRQTLKNLDTIFK